MRARYDTDRGKGNKRIVMSSNSRCAPGSELVCTNITAILLSLSSSLRSAITVTLYTVILYTVYAECWLLSQHLSGLQTLPSQSMQGMPLALSMQTPRLAAQMTPAQAAVSMSAQHIPPRQMSHASSMMLGHSLGQNLGVPPPTAAASVAVVSVPGLKAPAVLAPSAQIQAAY